MRLGDLPRQSGRPMCRLTLLPFFLPAGFADRAAGRVGCTSRCRSTCIGARKCARGLKAHKSLWLRGTGCKPVLLQHPQRKTGTLPVSPSPSARNPARPGRNPLTRLLGERRDVTSKSTPFSLGITAQSLRFGFEAAGLFRASAFVPARCAGGTTAGHVGISSFGLPGASGTRNRFRRLNERFSSSKRRTTRSEMCPAAASVS